MDSLQVRTADSIFTDSVNLQHSLSEIEKETEGVDSLPVTTVAELVEKNVRLELCYRELRTLNNSGEFYGRHPFISQRSERERITDLLKTDPDKWFEERKNVELNITRYQSHLNSKKSDEAKKERARANIEKYKALLQMYKEVFSTIIQGHA